MDAREPIWIDLQVNGFAGIDFSFPDITVSQVKDITRRLASEGTAGYCPTIVTCNPEITKRSLAIIAEARRADSICHERILGVHLEGPFISDKPGAVGAHPPEWVRKPDIKLFQEFQEASDGCIRLLTIAAEAEGAVEFCQAVTNTGVTVSLGHQLSHTPAELGRLAEAGAKALTHLGNGIPNLLPRHDNVIWAGLAEDRLTVMFIPDGHHLPLQILKVYTRAVPIERLVAVTDCSFPGGLPPGKYNVFGNDAVLEANGLLHNPVKQCLVGSTATMAQVVDVLQSKEVGLSYEQCLAICRDNPLRLIGIK